MVVNVGRLRKRLCLACVYVFHNQCIRTMCRVTRKHTWTHRISDDSLLQRLHLHPIINYYIHGRKLCWLGKVARMSTSRLLRHMLSSWVKNRRPVGRPRLTYGATIQKGLKHFSLTEKQTGLHCLAHSCVQPRTMEIVNMSG